VVLGVILALGAVGAGAWFLFLRPGAPIDLGGDDHPVPDFSFELRKVNAASVGEEESDLDEAAEGVQETLDALYVAGFVDPDKWEDGTFPEVLEQFDRTAAKQAAADLPFLTLGGEAQQIAFVEPVLGKVDIRFLVDAEAQPAGAVATTKFVADGEFDGGDPLFVLHDGTYYLEPDDDGWVIVGYDVDGVVQPGRRARGGPTAGPTGQPTP
jgi:hypothetical protein